MSTGLVIFLAALQGATELFPVSSLGHAVVVPALFHLGVDPSAASFVPFLALLHLGTGFALLFLYRDEWWRIIRGFFRAAINGRIETSDERLAFLLVVATIPAGRFGTIEDFGAMCAFLCSGQASYVTGQNWLCDGGMYPGTF